MSNKYVSTTGSDAADGSVSTPWLTWQWAVDHVSAGDAINILPGTYASSVAARACRATVSGTSGNPIVLQGSGGVPVLSGVNLTGAARFGLEIAADWWNVIGVDVTNVTQLSAGQAGWGVYVHGDNNIIDRVRSYANYGPGFQLGAAHNTLFRNCDSYNNNDSLSTVPGGNADGFAFGWDDATLTGNIAEYCRAWGNSDDGFDLYEQEAVLVLRYNWAFSNAVNGYKMGRNDLGPLHQFLSNLGFANGMHGFTSNGAGGPLLLYSNTAFGNVGGQGISLSDPSIAHILRNNAVDTYYIEPPNLTNASYNSWNLGLTVNAADFTTISTVLAAQARETDGSLPKVGLFQPMIGSDLLGAGVDIGLPFFGTRPDVGAVQRPVVPVHPSLGRGSSARWP